MTTSELIAKLTADLEAHGDGLVYLSVRIATVGTLSGPCTVKGLTNPRRTIERVEFTESLMIDGREIENFAKDVPYQIPLTLDRPPC